MRPRQLGGPKDFEEARHDIEQLPLLTDAHSVALHAHERLLALVPSIPKTVADQLERRLKPEGPKLAGAKPEAAALLSAFDDIYGQGPGAYFHAMDRLLATCGELGYHLPRADATRAIRQTAAALMPGTAIPATPRCLRPAGRRDLAPRTAAHRPRAIPHDRPPGQRQGVRRHRVFPVDARRWPDDASTGACCTSR